jgi:Cys-tRNA(Pro)/Cys-tRNA(Cys) deacylase
MAANNVIRFLDNRKVPYSVFELPQEKLGGEECARLLNAPPEIIFKSIVILRKGSGKPILAVVPGNQEVDLKKLAKAVGEKKVTPSTQKEAENITKLQAGGISPLALINRGFEIVIHRSVQDFKLVHVSGGELGVNIRLSSNDLIDLTRAKVADIS